MFQNSTIEERVTLLELQVLDIQEDVGNLDENVDFLFEEQIIQDERIFSLEETSDQLIVELAQINENLEGTIWNG